MQSFKEKFCLLSFFIHCILVKAQHLVESDVCLDGLLAIHYLTLLSLQKFCSRSSATIVGLPRIILDDLYFTCFHGLLRLKFYFQSVKKEKYTTSTFLKL